MNDDDIMDKILADVKTMPINELKDGLRSGANGSIARMNPVIDLGVERRKRDFDRAKKNIKLAADQLDW